MADVKNPQFDASAATGSAPALEILQAMLDGAREGLCIMTPEAILLHSNQVAGELLGFQPKEAAGRPAQLLGVELGFDWTLAGEVVAGRIAVSTVQTLRTDRKLLVSAVRSFRTTARAPTSWSPCARSPAWDM